MTKPKQKNGGFMCWLNLRGFMDTPAEWHAWVLGFCETFCPLPPRHTAIDEATVKILREERWYYVFGRVLGFIFLLLFAVGIVALFKAAVT